MIHAVASVWAWLTGRRKRAPVAVTYDPKRDPLVRPFRQERLAAERAVHRIERRRKHLNPISEAAFPSPHARDRYPQRGGRKP